MDDPDKKNETAAGDDIVSKRRNNGSIIWKWFGLKKKDEQQLQVICRECNKTVASKSGSTTNLFHHLQQRHQVQYEECVKLRGGAAAVSPTAKASSAPKQCLLQESFTRGEQYDKKTAKWREITKAVA